MASYKDKVARDLDRWIASGLIAPDKRADILATLPDPRRLDAATALAWVGGALFGIAIIAFVAANWDGIPRLPRFVLLLGFFAAACGAAAWAAHTARLLLTDIALTVAALIFAAAIGLTGQIFDIVGDPSAALYGAGLAGMALALAGRSVGAAIATLIFIGFGDFQGGEWYDRARLAAPWLVVFAPLNVALALRWSSAPLAHASAVGMLVALFWFIARFEHESVLALLFAMALAGSAFAARWLTQQDKPHASVFYGWAAWGALMFFAIAGYADTWRGDLNWGLPHRIAWLAASGGAIALGRFDRHAMVTAVGVLSIIGAMQKRRSSCFIFPRGVLAGSATKAKQASLGTGRAAPCASGALANRDADANRFSEKI